MNALIRIPELVETRPKPSDPSLLGVAAAIFLWVLLHAGFLISWLSAGAH